MLSADVGWTVPSFDSQQQHETGGLRMKVVYKKSIIDKLVDAITEAQMHNKEIEKFVLTKAEADELQKSCPFTIRTLGQVFAGVPFEVEDCDEKEK